jgi:hypothetical protein
MKTFTQFLEQRDPELYEQMSNEGVVADMYKKGKGFLKTVGGAATAAAGTVLTGAALAAALASGGGEVKAPLSTHAHSVQDAGSKQTQHTFNLTDVRNEKEARDKVESELDKINLSTSNIKIIMGKDGTTARAIVTVSK